MGNKRTSWLWLSLSVLLAFVLYTQPAWAVEEQSAEAQAVEAQSVEKSAEEIQSEEASSAEESSVEDQSEEHPEEQPAQKRQPLRAPRRTPVKSGVQEIDGKLYLYDAQGVLRRDNAWVEFQGRYYFPNAEGVLYRDRVITFGSKVAYYMDHDGSMGTGFREVGDALMYFNDNGVRNNSNAWVETERGWVFPNANGLVYRDRVITFGSKVAYYMDHDGTRGTGFREVGDALMYFNDNGVRNNSNAWVKTNRGWVFPNANGLVYRDQVITFGSQVAYYMDHDGTKGSGFREVSGMLMYFKENGLRDNSNTWVKTDRGWIFPNAKGQVYRNQFITFGKSVAYYMGNDGVAVSGMVNVNGTVYRMTGKNGARLVQEGEYSAEGKVFYADSYGEPVRNRLITINGKQYYHGADGARYYKNFILGQDKYTVDPATGAIQKKETNTVKSVGDGAPKLYLLRDLQFQGVIRWNGYLFTYYSQSVLPGPGLRIPGRHVNKDGYVADGDGFIVLANDAPKGTIIPTPFGYFGKVYDRGTTGNHFDVYTK